MTDHIERLRELLAKAGNYPPLKPVGHMDRYYSCPLCDGEGVIDADFVAEGTETTGGGILTSVVGVQVFGIGDAMTAMEKLVPAAIAALPALLAVAEAAKKVSDHYEKEWQYPLSPIERDLMQALANLEKLPNNPP